MKDMLARIARLAGRQFAAAGRFAAQRIWLPMVRSIAYTRTIKVLREMDDHMLRDLGIERDRIRSLVHEMVYGTPADGTSQSDGRRVANDNATQAGQDAASPPHAKAA